MPIIFTLIGILVTAFLGYVIVGFLFTSSANAKPEAAEFAAGTFPDPLPSGDLNGTAEGQGAWVGKSFDSEAGAGINRFNNGGTIDRNVEFKTYSAKGLTNPSQDVLRLDYNLAQNPFYVRFVQDELVQVAPGKYLGKIHLQVLPFIPFTVGYFRLEVQQ
jgi:hypothetical protein